MWRVFVACILVLVLVNGADVCSKEWCEEGNAYGPCDKNKRCPSCKKGWVKKNMFQKRCDEPDGDGPAPTPVAPSCDYSAKQKCKSENREDCSGSSTDCGDCKSGYAEKSRWDKTCEQEAKPSCDYAAKQKCKNENRYDCSGSTTDCGACKNGYAEQGWGNNKTCELVKTCDNAAKQKCYDAHRENCSGSSTDCGQCRSGYTENRRNNSCDEDAKPSCDYSAKLKCRNENRQECSGSSPDCGDCKSGYAENSRWDKTCEQQAKPAPTPLPTPVGPTGCDWNAKLQCDIQHRMHCQGTSTKCGACSPGFDAKGSNCVGTAVDACNDKVKQICQEQHRGPCVGNSLTCGPCITGYSQDVSRNCIGDHVGPVCDQAMQRVCWSQTRRECQLRGPPICGECLNSFVYDASTDTCNDPCNASVQAFCTSLYRKSCKFGIGSDDCGDCMPNYRDDKTVIFQRRKSKCLAQESSDTVTCIDRKVHVHGSKDDYHSNKPFCPSVTNTGSTTDTEQNSAGDLSAFFDPLYVKVLTVLFAVLMFLVMARIWLHQQRVYRNDEKWWPMMHRFQKIETKNDYIGLNGNGSFNSEDPYKLFEANTLKQHNIAKRKTDLFDTIVEKKYHKSKSVVDNEIMNKRKTNGSHNLQRKTHHHQRRTDHILKLKHAASTVQVSEPHIHHHQQLKHSKSAVHQHPLHPVQLRSQLTPSEDLYHGHDNVPLAGIADVEMTPGLQDNPLLFSNNDKFDVECDTNDNISTKKARKEHSQIFDHKFFSLVNGYGGAQSTRP